MEWTQKELEALYQEMQKKSMIDEAFRKELLEDADAALEKLAGKKLPKGCSIRVIENDPAYTATFVLPDLITEEVSLEDLNGINGGFSVLAIVSACAAAVSIAGCGADACAGQMCVEDMGCGAAACAGKVNTI